MEMKSRPKPGWVLGGLLLFVYFVIKLVGWSYARQVITLERLLEEMRPSLSAIVLSEQLENTRRACQEVASRVRRMDLKNSRLFTQLSSLPASITLTKLDLRSRLTLPIQGTFSITVEGAGIQSRHGTRIQGTILPGGRDPEAMLVRWAHSMQGDGANVVIRKLSPSLDTPDLWEFDLEVEDA